LSGFVGLLDWKAAQIQRLVVRVLVMTLIGGKDTKLGSTLYRR
jgi:hypothetical protein